MLCLSWPIAVRQNIVANKLKTPWKDMALFETQQETVCSAHPQLALHIKKGSIDGKAVAGDVVDNDSRVGFVTHYDAYGGC